MAVLRKCSCCIKSMMPLTSIAKLAIFFHLAQSCRNGAGSATDRDMSRMTLSVSVGYLSSPRSQR